MDENRIKELTDMIVTLGPITLLEVLIELYEESSNEEDKQAWLSSIEILLETKVRPELLPAIKHLCKFISF